MTGLPTRTSPADGEPFPGHVLVVGDAAVVLRLEAQLVAIGLGATATLPVHDLPEAMRLIGRSIPSMAIVDLDLAEHEGADAVRRLRDVAPDLPLLVLVSSDDAGSDLLKAGADDYVVKEEFDRRDLERAIRYALERRRLRTSVSSRSEGIETAERRFRSLIEASADGILIVDGRGVVRVANERAGGLVGVPGIDLVGMDLGVPIGGADAVEVESVAMGEGGLRDGPVRMEMRIFPTEWAGEPAHLVVLRDVTAHRTLEERLRQAQKMEALGQLTGGIAHDFNNVLTVILSGTDMLTELIPAESTEAHAELRDIEASAAHAAGMVRRLLGFSRKGYLRFETVELRDFAEEAFALMRRVLAERVETRMSIADDVGRIRADPAALQQIILNVVTNARDAMPDGGTLRITCSRSSIGESHRDRHPWVRPGLYESIAITDTGVGMDEHVRAQIFEPFFTTKDPGSGTGLGMAMVYGLMKQHRGLVHVYSVRGEGTTVKLLFPASQEPSEALVEPRARSVDPPGRGETILVIEDEPALRRGLERILTQAGYGVVLARDGMEGLELYRRAPGAIDLIMSDLVMPKLGGREVLSRLRAEGDACRFLLATGYGPASVAELTRLGVTVISKPWSRDDLLKKVDQALRGDGTRSSADARIGRGA